MALDPLTDDVVFECTGELDGGNVQIHPPVGQPEVVMTGTTFFRARSQLTYFSFLKLYGGHLVFRNFENKMPFGHQGLQPQ